ncbi:MAG: DinB family protein [Bdellovibrionales bacterium]|nr:DinB family protein [Bdellovibrionales bacterium]
MPERYIWVERKFRFELPVWMFPNTVERVRGGPARAEDAVRGLSDKLLTSKVGEQWSIQEHIGHLVDLESLWATRLDEFIAGASHLTAWEETNRATYDAKHNDNEIGTILGKFRAERAKFVQRLDELDDFLIERQALHPRLQTPMRLIDLVYFVAEHDDHHLADITRLRRRFG